VRALDPEDVDMKLEDLVSGFDAASANIVRMHFASRALRRSGTK